MPLNRREFIRNGTLLVAMGLAAPSFLTRSVVQAQERLAGQTGRRTLVVLQLSGGNDGLNTVIPVGDGEYQQIRQQLAIPHTDTVPLGDGLALHPNLAPLKSFYDAGQLAIVQGVGYPNPNRSHFRSMEIWHTATPEQFERSGWLGRYLEGCSCGQENPLNAINSGDILNRSFWTDMSLVPAIGAVATFQYQTDPKFGRDRAGQLQTLANIFNHAGAWRPYEEIIRQTTLQALAGADTLKAIAGTYETPIEYPQNPLANSLKTVAQVTAADLGTRIFYTSIGGFDTHANQPQTHANLLNNVAQSLSAFYRDLERLGRADDVVTMTFSEFGRRPAQNGSNGTDHGTAAPMFLIGPAVRGGVHGAHPSLADLDEVGDLRFHTDFRSVYATVLERWLGTPAGPVIGGEFPKLNLFA